MERIEIDVASKIGNILPEKLITDIGEYEQICPTCEGLGVALAKRPYGIKGDMSEAAKKERLPYIHQCLNFCPDCYSGVIKLCEFCKAPLAKNSLSCECIGYKKFKREKEAVEKTAVIRSAEAVSEESVKDVLLYCEENNTFYDSVDELFARWEDKEDPLPERLWVCELTPLSLDANSILESACEDLHEEAANNCDEEELQKLLDEYVKKQVGANTYFPTYKQYVVVSRDTVERGRNE